jgi:Na+/H+ antiporter NhaD/arsenite permease-like protein
MNYLLAALFVLAYACIAAREVPFFKSGRAGIAVLGAVVIVAVGKLSPRFGLTFRGAEEAIERSTLLLLFGTMIVARGFAEAGAFARGSRLLQPLAKNPRLLLATLALVSWFASALLVNDAICILLTPFVIHFLQTNRLPLKPYMFAIAMGSNAGSAYTLGGNPQNMLVARLSGISYRQYVGAAALPTTVALVVTIAGLLWVFRAVATVSSDSAPSESAAALSERAQPPFDGPLALSCAGALVALVGAACVGVPLPGAALVAGALVLAGARSRATRILETVDYGVLVFFSALFVLVAALGKTGVVEPLLAALPTVGGPPGAWLLSGVLLVGSQIVSNVPLILLLEPYLRHLGDPTTTWVLTALVSTLAGNFSLLGSVANVIVFEQARAEAPVGFVEYARIGVPVTVAATALAVGAFLALHD